MKLVCMLLAHNNGHEWSEESVMARFPGFLGNATNEKSEGKLEKGEWGEEGEWEVAQVGILQICILVLGIFFTNVLE